MVNDKLIIKNKNGNIERKAYFELISVAKKFGYSYLVEK